MGILVMTAPVQKAFGVQCFTLENLRSTACGLRGVESGALGLSSGRNRVHEGCVAV